MALSEGRRYQWRRYLPHLQNGCAPIFVTMSTYQHLHLPPEARTMVMEHIQRENETRIALHAVVVMPDHVHLLFSPLEDRSGQPFGLAEIMNGIRGPSAHRINKLLRRKGRVWNEEFFDHVPRFREADQELEYIYDNPVRAGLVPRPEDYQWLWIHPAL